MTEWKRVKLGDICYITSSKRIFAMEYQKEGIPFYRGKEIIEKHQGNNVSTELFISRQRYEEIRTKYDVPKRGDILLSSVGTLGVSWLVDEDEFYFKDGNLTWLRPNELTTSNYLYLWLNSPDYQHQIDTMCIGSTQKALTIETLNKFNVLLPDIITQKKICAQLHPIMEKIKNNRMINENLAHQARAMFQQWFAKATGSLCHLAEIADINPETYSTKDNWEFVNYLDTSNITTGTIAEVQYIQPSQEKLPSRARRILRKNDIVYSTVRPNQLHYGIISNPLPNMLGSTGFAVIRSKRKIIPNEIIYLALTDPAFVEKMHQLAEQSVSTYPSIKPLDLNACVIPEPQQDDADFTNAIITIFDIIASNNEENRRLAELCDTLLPRLMSGELDVSALGL